ncbi:hypothetical protein ACIBG8_19410 [Nonomuraea sp. NPDC050556]|uniref:hypothetical protein n=1 Tax=Nonomuraea sp. NPDC050556 TaxID=3364369 RepID=UPI0037928AC0
MPKISHSGFTVVPNWFEHNEAFTLLMDAEIISFDRLMTALEADTLLELHGPWQGSDYSGSDVTESNQRSLARDYLQLLEDYTHYSWHSPYGLCIDARTFGNGENREAAVDLAKTLAGLKYEYPLYDEEDNSALIQERAVAGWDSWIRSDIEAEIQKKLGLDVDLSEHRDDFWDALREADIWVEAEGHRDVTMPGIFDMPFLEVMARKAVSAGHVDVEFSELDVEFGREILGVWMAADYPDEPRTWVHPDQLPLF